MVIKRILFFIFLPVFIFSLSITVNAEETNAAPEDYEDLLEAVPDDIAELLPDGIFSSDMDEIGAAVQEATSWEYIWNVVFDLIGLNLKDALKIFAEISGLLVLCSLLNMLKNTIKNENLSSILTLVGSVVIASAIVEMAKTPLDRINLFFEQLKTLVNTMTPMICSLYAMGGNVSTAVVQNYGMMMFLTIFENICIGALQLILGICLALAVSSAFMPNMNLKPLSDAIKKTFTFFIGLVMLIFSTVLSTQTLLSSKADSLSAKTAKMFAGQMIPLVGGTVGDTLRTAGASIEYLRSTVGTGIIIIFLLLVLPTVLSVWGFRLSFIASNAVSGLLGCEQEGRMVSEIASIYGYILAIVSICSVVLLFLLTLFVRCSSAISG